MKKISILILAVSFFLSMSAHAGETEQPHYNCYGYLEPSHGMKAVDLFLVRPVSLSLALSSTAALLAISPIVYLVGMGDPALQVMVKAPWRFTSARPLGDFSNYKDHQQITTLPEGWN